MEAKATTPRHGLAGRDRWRTLLVGTSLALAGIALFKFVTVKPIFFLFIALLYLGGIALLRRQPRAGTIMLGVLNLLFAAFLALYIPEALTDGFESAADAIALLVGLPTALAGGLSSIAASRLTLWKRGGSDKRQQSAADICG